MASVQQTQTPNQWVNANKIFAKYLPIETWFEKEPVAHRDKRVTPRAGNQMYGCLDGATATAMCATWWGMQSGKQDVK